MSRTSNTCTWVATIHTWTDEEKHFNSLWIGRSRTFWANGFTCFMCTTKGLAERMAATGFDWHELARFELEQVEMARQGKLEEATVRWVLNWERLMLLYWPDCPKPAWLALKEQLVVLRTACSQYTAESGSTPETQILSRLRSCSQ